MLLISVTTCVPLCRAGAGLRAWCLVRVPAGKIGQVNGSTEIQ